MKKDVAIKLREKCEEIARNFSRKDREKNPGETFTLDKIYAVSGDSAVVTFLKNTDKKAVVYLYWVNQDGGLWRYFFPTDGHLVGMEWVKRLKVEVEIGNFPKNFS